MKIVFLNRRKVTVMKFSQCEYILCILILKYILYAHWCVPFDVGSIPTLGSQATVSQNCLEPTTLGIRRTRNRSRYKSMMLQGSSFLTCSHKSVWAIIGSLIIRIYNICSSNSEALAYIFHYFFVPTLNIQWLLIAINSCQITLECHLFYMT